MTLSVAEIERAAAEERNRLSASDKWSAAYKDAEQQTPLLVGGRGPDKEYYIVQFHKDGRTKGLMLVNARTGEVGSVTGVQTPEASMHRFYRPEEIPPLLDGRTERVSRKDDFVPVTISAAKVEVTTELYWVPCDQSVTPFQPFYVVHHVDDAGGKDRFYVRVDGEVYTTITRGAAGM